MTTGLHHERSGTGEPLVLLHGIGEALQIWNPCAPALAEHFEGKRFNSPNDLALRKNGDVYFTDPPYGLKGLDKSPLKEMTFNGVYRISPDLGTINLLTRDLYLPNGLAFSADEKILYIGDSRRR